MGFQFNVSLLITAGSFAGIYRYKPEQAVSFLLGQKHDDKPLDNSPKAGKRNRRNKSMELERCPKYSSIPEWILPGSWYPKTVRLCLESGTASEINHTRATLQKDPQP